MFIDEKVLMEKIEELISPDAITRLKAKYDLTGVGETIIPALIKVIKEDQRAEVRYWTIDVLGSFKTKAKEAVPLFLKLLVEDDSERVRSICPGVLKEIAENLDEIIPVLIFALKQEKSAEVQRNLNFSLLKIAEKLGYANVEELIKKFENT